MRWEAPKSSLLSKADLSQFSLCVCGIEYMLYACVHVSVYVHMCNDDDSDCWLFLYLHCTWLSLLSLYIHRGNHPRNILTHPFRNSPFDTGLQTSSTEAWLKLWKLVCKSHLPGWSSRRFLKVLSNTWTLDERQNSLRSAQFIPIGLDICRDHLDSMKHGCGLNKWS